jgi:tungstate transport system ATP-binding protein
VDAYRLTNVVFSYDTAPAVHIDALDIERGCITGIAGKNGSGKSTLLRILAFLLHPQQGAVAYCGTAVSSRNAGALRRRVTYLPQRPVLLKRSVRSNLCYPLRLAGIPAERKRICEVMTSLKLSPEQYLDRSWRALSGGEAKRVALAQRLVIDTETILLDEPTAETDEEAKQAITAAVKAGKSSSAKTVVVASHDHVWLSGVADRIIFLEGGRLSEGSHVNIIGSGFFVSDNSKAFFTLAGGQRVCCPPPEPGKTTAYLLPEDIMLAADPLTGVSARNCLRGTVCELTSANGGMLVKVDVGGVCLTAAVTEEAARQMNLQRGASAYAVFKYSAIKWL